MDALLAALVGLLLGGIVGYLLRDGLHRAGGASAAVPGDETIPEPDQADVIADAGLADLLAVLPSSAMVLSASDTVVLQSPAASALGLVRSDRLAHEELRALVRAVRRDGVIRESEFDLSRGLLGSGTLSVGARAAPIGAHHVILLVEDRTQARRIEQVRRDFVANVSHELKTPVGGICLLAEAVLDAREDPVAVARFTQRIQVESARLTCLVKEIIDLSRLQASQTLADPVLVAVRSVVQETLQEVRTLAESRNVALALSIEDDPLVYGDAAMIGNAVTNLLVNAINYSPDHTRVAVTVRTIQGVVEIAVADQGQGIASADQQRIFERFYRGDPARSRATGGTGLGLAIVKHICTNHGGEVRVWSSFGNGSTFTIRLPTAGAVHSPAREPHLAPAPTEGETP